MKLVDINGNEVSLNDPPRVAFSEPEAAGIRIYGDQNQRFLSADTLGISGKPLKAKGFPEAITEAQDVVREEYVKMRLSVETFLEEEKPAVPLKQFLKLTGPAMIEFLRKMKRARYFPERPRNLRITRNCGKEA